MLVVAEGMLFANSRIAMNDVYVTTFIMFAALLFAPLYLSPRRPWTAVAILIGVGVALGLALASKWVALYAIGGLGLLVLLRSGLGRALALLAMVGMTAVLGAMAIRPAPVEDPNRNWAFLLLMLLLSGLLTAGIVRRPLPFSRTEVALVTVVPVAAGVVLVLLGQVLLGGLLLVAAVVAVLVTLVATARGRGPFAGSPPLPDSDTSGWLRPSWLLGLPWLLTLAAVGLLPIAVYIISYAPWVELGNQWGLPLLDSLPGLPASSTDGDTVAGLTESMYQYHDNLRAEHAASSPWWAWPLDLKPVWFFQERYAGPTTGLIYDTGNLVVFWLGLAGVGFSAVAAWRRHSVALTLVVILWAALWLPWARIDRATFQYHVYASLPFLVLALSYLLAELWHGATLHAWFLARAAAALAIVAIPLMWLFRTPLCILAGTAVAHPDGIACSSEVTRTAQLSEAGMAALLFVAIGAGFAGYLGWRASRASSGYPDERSPEEIVWMAALVLTGLATLGGVIAAFLLLDTGSPVSLALSSDILAIMGLVVLAVPAWLVMRARDARRYVLAVLAIAVLWFVVWYPNISGLPLPSEFAALYQGILPTWNWDFQFAVNTDIASDAAAIDLSTFVIGGVTAAFVVGVGVAARRWGRDPEAAVGDGDGGPGR